MVAMRLGLTRSEPAAPVRVVFAGGIPTIVPVDAPIGYYLRAGLLPDGRWLMALVRVRCEGGVRGAGDLPARLTRPSSVPAWTRGASEASPAANP